MQTVFGFDAITSDWPESTVCIGVFDGMHLGHQAIVRETVTRARDKGRPSIAITFDRHPLATISPEHCPPSISTPDAKLERFAQEGVDVAVIATFDLAFSQLAANDFFSSYLLARLHAKEMVVGHDFAFGYKRTGTTDWLSSRIQTDVIPALVLDGERISSSRVRDLITQGHVSKAARLLGRNFTLGGVAVRGQRLGSKLGVPTANLVPVLDQVVPSPGIYAGFSTIDGRAHSAAISVGFRPAVPGAGFAVEAHFMDFAVRDLYGRSIPLEFVERLRDELNFDSLTELKHQMDLDIKRAREVLVNHG
jgi:riboflavin kinase/FMN adenylyltransferase